MSEEKKPGGPDLTQGVLPADFAEGKLLGHVAGDEVLLVQVGSEVLAIDPYGSHYHGPLAEGLVVDDTIRCPWHHACFSLRTGEATRPPALSSVSVYQVEREGDKIFVPRRLETRRTAAPHAATSPGKIVIVGGGAAGFATAEMPRREDLPASSPCSATMPPRRSDRPNLSKDRR